MILCKKIIVLPDKQFAIVLVEQEIINLGGNKIYTHLNAKFVYITSIFLIFCNETFDKIYISRTFYLIKRGYTLKTI